MAKRKREDEVFPNAGIDIGAASRWVVVPRRRWLPKLTSLGLLLSAA